MKNFCPLPWTSVEVNAMGKIKPCCLSTEPIIDRGTAATISTHTMKEALNSPYMDSLRQEFLNDQRPERCRLCWEVEKSGDWSKRMHAVKAFNDVEPTTSSPLPLSFLDLKLGNICNIKCRICGPHSSSSWAEEAWRMNKDHKFFKVVSENGRWPREATDFWEEIVEVLPSITRLEITGGEPFLIEEQFAVLEKAVELGYSKNIDIHYNTNGTIYPERALTEIWPHFKSVEIAFSIDDIGARFEYERFPAKWAEVQDNITRINRLRLSNLWLKTQICCTVNKQNIYYLPEVTDFILAQRLSSWHYNLLHQERMFSIATLAPAAKSDINARVANRMSGHSIFQDRVVPILNFMNEPSDNLDAAFLFRIEQHDRYRKQSFAGTFPELHAIITQ
jgi:MoaA/NifB/PqqE/SkfB family radical SAM enzyme